MTVVSGVVVLGALWTASVCIAFAGGFWLGDHIGTRDTERRWKEAVDRKAAYDRLERET